MSDFISNRSELVRLGWVDNQGRTLDWKYWNRQPKKIYTVLEEIDEAEWKLIQLEKEKKRKQREEFLRNNPNSGGTW